MNILLGNQLSETRRAPQFPQLNGIACAHTITPQPPEPPAAGNRFANTENDDGDGGDGDGDGGPPGGTGAANIGGLKAATAYKHAWRRAERARIAAQHRKVAREDPPPF